MSFRQSLLRTRSKPRFGCFLHFPLFATCFSLILLHLFNSLRTWEEGRNTNVRPLVAPAFESPSVCTNANAREPLIGIFAKNFQMSNKGYWRQLENMGLEFKMRNVRVVHLSSSSGLAECLEKMNMILVQNASDFAGACLDHITQCQNTKKILTVFNVQAHLQKQLTSIFDENCFFLFDSDEWLVLMSQKWPKCKGATLPIFNIPGNFHSLSREARAAEKKKRDVGIVYLKEHSGHCTDLAFITRLLRDSDAAHSVAAVEYVRTSHNRVHGYDHASFLESVQKAKWVIVDDPYENFGIFAHEIRSFDVPMFFTSPAMSSYFFENMTSGIVMGADSPYNDTVAGLKYFFDHLDSFSPLDEIESKFGFETTTNRMLNISFLSDVVQRGIEYQASHSTPSHP
mmetsp:Transcript_43136/g.111813  ORF Transcript_43136/g.111813 Transcript_43136/m.111813 type:complete len:399 (-) Transcript_43136:129-1325(-)